MPWPPTKPLTPPGRRISAIRRRAEWRSRRSLASRTDRFVLSGCDQKETLCGQKETGRRWVVEPLAKPEARAPLGPQGGRGPSGARREKIFTPAAKEFLNALLGGYP